MRASANNCTNGFLRPPTIRIRTTKRAQLPGCTSSRFLRTRLNATPSLSAVTLNCRHLQMVSTTSCTPQRGADCKHRLSWAFGTPKSMSCTKRFVATSTHLATALSNEKPLLPSTPDREQPARCWAKASRRRPHRQTRSIKRKGKATLEKDPVEFLQLAALRCNVARRVGLK